MKAEEKIITQMGIISKEVYDDGEDKQYFRQNPKNMVVDGVLYRVIDYVDKRTDMQALLLERGETYVLALRDDVIAHPLKIAHVHF